MAAENGQGNGGHVEPVVKSQTHFRKHGLDDGVSRYDENWKKTGDVYKNFNDDGVTVYKDGKAEERYYQNLLDDGVSKYDQYGTKQSTTYKNMTGDGVTTINRDGSTSVTRKNLFSDGYTTYTYASSSQLAQQAADRMIADMQAKNAAAAKPQPEPDAGEHMREKGSYESVKQSELDKLDSVQLEKDDAVRFGWYAALLLRKKGVPFDKKIEGENCWKLRLSSSSYGTSARETDTDDEWILTENGLYRTGHIRTYYAPGKKPTVDSEWTDCALSASVIDYFLKKHGIDFSSKQFAAMSEKERNSLADLGQIKRLQEKVGKRRKKALELDKQKGANWMFEDWMRLDMSWWFMAAVFLCGVMTMILPDLNTAGRLTVMLVCAGCWLILHPAEDFSGHSLLGVICFACAILNMGENRPSPFFLLLFVAGVMIGLDIYLMMTRYEDYDTNRTRAAVAATLLGADMIACALGAHVVHLPFVGLFTLVMIVATVVQASRKLKWYIRNKKIKFTHEWTVYKNKRRWLLLPVSFAMLAIPWALAEYLPPLIAGGLSLAAVFVLSALFTNRADVEAKQVRRFTDFTAVGMLCWTGLSCSGMNGRILSSAANLDSYIKIPVLGTILSGIFDAAAWVGEMCEKLVFAVGGLIPEGLRILDRMWGLRLPTELLDPDPFVRAGMFWLPVLSATVLGAYLGHAVSRKRSLDGQRS